MSISGSSPFSCWIMPSQGSEAHMKALWTVASFCDCPDHAQGWLSWVFLPVSQAIYSWRQWTSCLELLFYSGLFRVGETWERHAGYPVVVWKGNVSCIYTQDMLSNSSMYGWVIKMQLLGSIPGALDSFGLGMCIFNNVATIGTRVWKAISPGR